MTLRELFTRIVFNICMSNTDDHARNHEAFWNGRELSLTAAYDLVPQLRTGDTAAQAMAIDRDGRRASRLGLCRQAASIYHLSDGSAEEIITQVTTSIAESWTDAAEAARLTRAERDLLWRKLILPPSINYDDF